MRLFSFAHTRTDAIPPEQLEESLQKELEALHAVAVAHDAPSRHEVIPTSITRMSRIMSILSRQADVQTRRIVRLTWMLLGLTAALTILTGYLCYDAYTNAHGNQQEHRDTPQPHQPTP